MATARTYDDGLRDAAEAIRRHNGEKLGYEWLPGTVWDNVHQRMAKVIDQMTKAPLPTDLGATLHQIADIAATAGDHPIEQAEALVAIERLAKGVVG